MSQEAICKFDFDVWHEFLIINNNVDALVMWGDNVWIAVHFGNMKGFYQTTQKSLECVKRAIEAPDQTKELFGG